LFEDESLSFVVVVDYFWSVWNKPKKTNEWSKGLGRKFKIYEIHKK
jgi:hypothetical protein